VRHVVLEEWSRRQSWLHQRDPRAKCLALVVFLILVATSDKNFPLVAGGYLILLIALVRSARLPLGAVLARSAVVLPFSFIFGLVSALAGNIHHAVLLVSKSYLSALAVLITIATSPVPKLLYGLEQLGIPQFLLWVVQFLYRYLFVVSEEAQRMHSAVVARGASLGALRARGVRFQAAAGALAVLFLRSYGRAEDIHRAMLARGFQGGLRQLSASRFGWKDGAFVLAAGVIPAALRILLEARLTWFRQSV